MYRQIRKATAKTRPRRFAETGQGVVEYAIIIALVAILAIGATSFLGGRIKGTLSGVGGSVNGAVLGANQPGSGQTPAPTPGNPDNYHNSGSCQAAGFFWYNNDCHSHPGDAHDYHNSGECWTAGYYWYNGDCHSSRGSSNDYDHDSSGCQAAGYFWYSNDCHSSPAPTPTPTPTAPPKPTPPPAPTQTGHSVGQSCSLPGPDGHWHWDAPVWHDYTFDSTPSPGHWENGFWSGGWDCR